VTLQIKILMKKSQNMLVGLAKLFCMMQLKITIQGAIKSLRNYKLQPTKQLCNYKQQQ
jgi:hypothetical protein